VLIETPEQVFAEYTAHTKAARTGRILHHFFAARLVANKGTITLLRESLNTVAAAQALNPNGVADLPPPKARFSPFRTCEGGAQWAQAECVFPPAARRETGDCGGWLRAA
jgi:hypothetical protein